jgi:hypothetical protein
MSVRYIAFFHVDMCVAIKLWNVIAMRVSAMRCLRVPPWYAAYGVLSSTVL